MPTFGQPKRICHLIWVALIAAWGCLAACSASQAQGLGEVEWAVTGQDADAASATEAELELRTPIQRTEQHTSERGNSGDARTTSWVWAWLPVGIALALWWLVGRLRSSKLLAPNVLPESVIVPLGQRSIGGGRIVQLIRIGSRILVVTPTTDGLQTLSEISDPQEVERLVSLCLRPNQGNAGIASLFGTRPIQSSAMPQDTVRERGKTTSPEFNHESRHTSIRQAVSSRMEHVGVSDSVEGTR